MKQKGRGKAEKTDKKRSWMQTQGGDQGKDDDRQKGDSAKVESEVSWRREGGYCLVNSRQKYILTRHYLICSSTTTLQQLYLLYDDMEFFIYDTYTYFLCNLQAVEIIYYKTNYLFLFTDIISKSNEVLCVLPSE